MENWHKLRPTSFCFKMIAELINSPGINTLDGFDYIYRPIIIVQANSKTCKWLVCGPFSILIV